jgi:FecR protein
MKRTLLLITLGALAASLALPQDFPQGQPGPGPQGQPGQGQQSGDGDVPGRAARLSLATGNVSFQPASVDDWIPATLNRPLTTSDRLWTEVNSRAELSLGSTTMRLGSRTNFSFINLNDRIAQVQLSLGSLSVRVRRLADDEAVEIDTPQVALSLLRPGEYRIDVNEQGDTTVVTVRSGQAEATSGQAFTINPRQQVRIASAGEGVAPTFDTRDMPPADQFDIWAQSRDRQEDMSQSSKYVSRDMPGYADLDAAGTWHNDPSYGAVWMPTGMGPDWAPYRTGHWAWIGPWGWTWVDDSPWGYAPYHYGRWAYVGTGWGWIPGPVVVSVRPVYAPALVAWVGGPSFGVSVGIGGGGGVGWFALGPREVYVPAYRYSPAYIERVNVTNTVIVNRTVFANVGGANVVYANRGVRGAIVAVPNGAFVSGRRVSAVAVVVRPEAVARVQVTSYAGVVPQREAVLGGRAAVSYRPPAVVVSRTVVTRATPPAPRVDFVHEREAIQNNQGRPLDRAGYNQIRQASPPPQRLNYRQATPAAVTQQGTPPVRNGAPNVTPRPDFRDNRTPPQTTTQAPPARAFERPASSQQTTQPPPARTFERPASSQQTTQPPPTRTFERPASTPAATPSGQHTQPPPQHQQTHPPERKHDERKPPEKDTKKP